MKVAFPSQTHLEFPYNFAFVHLVIFNLENSADPDEVLQWHLIWITSLFVKIPGPRDNKTFSMLNSNEYEIYHPDKCSDFIWDFGKLPFPADLGKYIIKNGKISTKIHEIVKIKTIFGLGMTPIY